MIELCLIGPTEEVEQATQFLRVPYRVISATDRVARHGGLHRYLRL